MNQVIRLQRIIMCQGKNKKKENEDLINAIAQKLIQENLLRSVGIFPAQHPSFVFNQYNDNRIQTQNNINSAVTRLISDAAIKQLEKLSEEGEIS